MSSACSRPASSRSDEPLGPSAVTLRPAGTPRAAAWSAGPGPRAASGGLRPVATPGTAARGIAGSTGQVPYEVEPASCDPPHRTPDSTGEQLLTRR